MQRSVAKFLLTSVAKARGSSKHYQNTRWDEKAQLSREQTDELAGKYIQPSTNKLSSAGLQPADPTQPSCRSVKPELCWRLEIQTHPPGHPPPPPLVYPSCQSFQPLVCLCTQVGMCLVITPKGLRERYVSSADQKVRDLNKMTETVWS